MATEPTTKKTRKRRVCIVSECIRIKNSGENPPGIYQQGELRAYADVLDYIGSAK